MDNASLQQLLQNNLFRENISNSAVNSQKNLLEQIKTLLPNKDAVKITDSVLSNYSVTKILEALQIPIDDIAIKITEAFLQKGVLPEGQEIVDIQKLVKEIPKPVNKEAAIQKAVELKLGGVDNRDAFVKETVITKLNSETVIKLLQELKTEVLNNAYLSSDSKVKISQLLQSIANEFESAENQNLKSTHELIVNKLEGNNKLVQILKDQMHGAQLIDNAKGQKIADLFNQIKQVIRFVIDQNISKNDLLKQTDFLMKSINQATQNVDDFANEINKLLENTKTQWQTFSNSAKITIQSSLINNNLSDQKLLNSTGDIVKLLNQLKVATIKLLEKIDAQFLQKRLFEIPEYIQNEKPNDLNVKSSSEPLTNYQSHEFYKLVDAQHLIKELKSLLLQSFESSNSDQEVGFKRILNAADISHSGLFSLQKILSEISNTPSNITAKSWLDALEEMFPDFIKFIKSKNFLADDTPELHRFQKLMQDSFGPDLANYKKGNLLKQDLQNKLIYTPQLQSDIEVIEKDFFNKSDLFSGLRKMHENLLRTESRLLSHEFFEKGSGKQDLYQTFDIKISPQIENQNTRLEFYRRKNDDEGSSNTQEELFSFHLDLNLKQTGVIKANLISISKQNQIHLFFAKPEVKSFAIGEQVSLQEQLASIPFPAQLFFHDLISDNTESIKPSFPPGFDQLA